MLSEEYDCENGMSRICESFANSIDASETESPQAQIDSKTRNSPPFASLQTCPIFYTSLRNIAVSPRKRRFWARCR